jgi:hypothetical protein
MFRAGQADPVIASAHQPHFLPWAGYLNKALRSEVFIWLHNVQYRKNYFQNRTRIKGQNGLPTWLTLPVHAHLGTRIDEVTLADSLWHKRIPKTIEQCYGRTPYFSVCWPPIASALADASDNLDDINYRTFLAVLGILGAESTCVRRAGELQAGSLDPTERLVELCAAAGATRYIAGKGGHQYLRLEAFARAGIEVVWQIFEPERIVYPQAGNGFIPGLSVLDCLCNVGPEETRELVLGAWTP